MLQSEYKASIAQQNWARAAQKLELLCPLEQELWSDGSLEATLATAAYAYVLDQLDRKLEASRLLGNVRESAAKLVVSVDPVVATAFLYPLIESRSQASAFPAYQWINFYLEQRFNTASVQREMVEYVIRQVEGEFPKDAEILRSRLKTATP